MGWMGNNGATLASLDRLCTPTRSVIHSVQHTVVGLSGTNSPVGPTADGSQSPTGSASSSLIELTSPGSPHSRGSR